jgi:hypothetical protein
MHRDILDYLALNGKSATARAQEVLSQVQANSLLEDSLQSVIDRHLESANIVDIEEEINSFRRLIEVFLCEGFEDRAQDCISEDVSGSKICTLRGFTPPLIEIYRETTSFRPASFRPQGYPGTDAWFDQFGGGIRDSIIRNHS